LALCVVEIGWDGNHRVSDFFAKVVFGGFLHFAKNVSANLLGGHAVATHFDPRVAVISSRDGVRHQIDVFLNFFFAEFTTNQALDRIQGIARVGDRLALGGRTDQYFAVFLVGNDRRRGASAFGVLNDLGSVAFHDGHTAVGGA